VEEFEEFLKGMVMEIIKEEHNKQGDGMKENDGAGLINLLIEKSVEARNAYLKIDVYVRAKLLLTENKEATAGDSFNEIMCLGKRIGIIRGELGEEKGNRLIQEAVDYLLKDLEKGKPWTERARKNIEYLSSLLGLDNVRIIR
jgi:hypothetical protein